MPAPDQSLLQQHHAGDPAAFSQLTARHIHWIYSAALRRTQDPHLAEDITQAVFLALATSKSAPSAKVLSAWLFGVLRFITAKALRSESRRRRHETQAAQLRQKVSNMETESDWQFLAPHLESAVASLATKDRQAILLRFYQQQSFPEIATALGSTEAAARKRVARAVAKLRTRLPAQGLTPEILATAILRHCTKPAPAHLLASIAVRAPASATASTLLRAWLHHLRLQLLAQISAAVAALVLLVALPIIILANHPALSAPMQATATTPPPSATPVVEQPDSATRPSNLTYDKVIASIQQTEHVFQNLHIKNFQTTTETKDPTHPNWAPSPLLYAGSAWYDANPDGPARLYLSDLVLPWKNGPAAWNYSVVDISYDGSQSHELRVASGPLHQTGTPPAAFISNGRHMMINPFQRNWTGAALSAQYYWPYPLSRVIAENAKDAKMPDVCEQTLRGLPAIRLHFGYEKNGKPFSEFNYWFAPTRGFVLLKEDNTLWLPDRTRYTSTEVLDLKPVGPSLWFPTRAVRIQEDPQKPGTYLRYTWHADDIIANDPNFDPKIFTAPILPGWAVSDVRTSTRVNYVQMPDGSHYILTRGTALPPFKPTPDTRPDAP